MSNCKIYFFVESFSVTVQDDDVLEMGQNLHLLLPHQDFRNQTCRTETRNKGNHHTTGHRSLLSTGRLFPELYIAGVSVLQQTDCGGSLCTFYTDLCYPGLLPSDEDLQALEVGSDVQTHHIFKLGFFSRWEKMRKT